MLRRKFYLLSGALSVLMIINFAMQAQTATVILRPTHVDISDAEARGAVLMNLSGYSTDDARYQLFSASSQYRPWNTEDNSYVTSNAYANGPKVPGTPTSSTSFWIAYVRGSHNSTAAFYRDRLGPSYGTNHVIQALPDAAEIDTVNRFVLSGSLTGSAGFPLTLKYITLAFAGETLVSASHSDLTTGYFEIVCPGGTTITRVEVRTLLDVTVGQIAGSWTADTDIGDIQLAVSTRVLPVEGAGGIGLYPVPAGATLTIEGIETFGVVEITDLTGRVVISVKTGGAASIVVPVAELGGGLYFVRLISGQGAVVVRFVKNH